MQDEGKVEKCSGEGYTDLRQCMYRYNNKATISLNNKET
jgi:hypothetical protein